MPQNLRDKMSKKNKMGNKVSMEYTRPVEIQDVFATNEIFTLFTQQRKVVDFKLCHL